MKRRVLILLCGLAGSALFASSAQAYISYTYCADSLQGRTSQAGDNDVAVKWAQLEAAGYDIVASYPRPETTYYTTSGTVEYRWLVWKFIDSRSVAHQRWAECWRDDLDKIYHDVVTSKIP